MGFFDSFSTGVGNLATGVGNFINTFAQTPVGTKLLERGVNELFDVIGGFDTSPPSGRGVPLGPLGSPVPGGITTLQAVEFCAGRTPQTIIPGTPWPCGGMATRGQSTPAPQRGSLTLPRAPLETGPPVQNFFNPTRPSFGALPPIPSSQPFGSIPGAINVGFGGPSMPAFPVGTQQGFPPNPFAQLIGSTLPSQFQTAGFPAALAPLARQLPGFIGGIIGGNLLDSAISGGGSVTPMFRPTMAGVRAQSFRATNPVTGQDVFFRPAGKPILWSSDLSACKRVRKVARRANRKR